MLDNADGGALAAAKEWVPLVGALCAGFAGVLVPWLSYLGTKRRYEREADSSAAPAHALEAAAQFMGSHHLTEGLRLQTEILGQLSVLQDRMERHDTDRTKTDKKVRADLIKLVDRLTIAVKKIETVAKKFEKRAQQGHGVTGAG